MPPAEPDRIAYWVVLLVRLPGLPPRRAGVLLLDPADDELHSALVESVSIDEDIKEVWDSMREELAARASEAGGLGLLDFLEQDLSHFVQVEGPRQQIRTADPKQTIAMLFRRYVLSHSAFSRGN